MHKCCSCLLQRTCRAHLLCVWYAGSAQASAPGSAAGSAGGVPTLEACIASFFAPEPVTWVCPAETAARKAAAGGARGRGSRRRSVSFSGALLGCPGPTACEPALQAGTYLRSESVTPAPTTCMSPRLPIRETGWILPRVWWVLTGLLACRREAASEADPRERRAARH